MQLVSDKAVIREMDAEELSHKYDLMINILSRRFQFTKEATILIMSEMDIVKYMSRIFLQLTGKSLF